jgi:hypothetical protein
MDMRTAILIACAILLWAICVAIAKYGWGSATGSSAPATLFFVVVWFAAASINLWLGVFRAGYAFTEELPIFLLIFGLPVLIAVLIPWTRFGAVGRG